MVVSDLNIICLEQSNPYVQEYDGISIDVVDRAEGAYSPGWQILKAVKGIWYSVYPCNYLGLRTYKNEFFDLGNRFGRTFYVEVMNEYKEEIISIVKFYLSESPVHKVDAMIWLDGDEKMPSICCSYDQFKELLINGKLFFGVLYHISGSEGR